MRAGFWLPRELFYEAGVVEDGCGGLGVLDGAALNHAQEFGELEAARFDAFVVFGMSLAYGYAGGEEDPHDFGGDAGGGEELHDFAPVARFAAGLFGEFAACSRSQPFFRFDVAGDQFPQEFSGGVTVLAHQQDGAILENGEDDDGAVVNQDLANGGYAAWLGNLVFAKVEDFALENFAAL